MSVSLTLVLNKIKNTKINTKQFNFADFHLLRWGNLTPAVNEGLLHSETFSWVMLIDRMWQQVYSNTIHSLHRISLNSTRNKIKISTAIWKWTKHDEGPYCCYYTHMKWEPSVSWGGVVVGDCGRGGEEDDRLLTATKQQHVERRHKQMREKQVLITKWQQSNLKSMEVIKILRVC